MTDSAGWNERYAATSTVWGGEPNQFVVQACRDLRPGRALDLGAGEGRNSFWLAEMGWMVTAVDFADVAVSRVTARAAMEALPVTGIVADALNFQAASASFELVVFSYLQLPLAQLRKTIANAAVSLAVHGRIVLVAHDASNLELGYGGPHNPDVLSTPEQVGRIMTDLGLQVVRAEVVTRRVDTPDGTRDAYDHVVVALRTE